MTSRTSAKTWTEELFARGLEPHVMPRGTSRGQVKVKERHGKLYVLVNSRWCRAERLDGQLFEVF